MRVTSKNKSEDIFFLFFIYFIRIGFLSSSSYFKIKIYVDISLANTRQIWI